MGLGMDAMDFGVGQVVAVVGGEERVAGEGRFG